MSSHNNNGGSGPDEQQPLQSPRALKTLKEGERILAPTRRPDGTLRKPIRIRAGYVPQDEIAIYQSKGVLLRKGAPQVPPGYDPELDVKPKTKAAKRNERKMEKKQQVKAALEKGKELGSEETPEPKTNEVLSRENGLDIAEVNESITCQMNKLSVSENPIAPSPDSTESSNTEIIEPDLDKRIRALKKKIRLTESQQQKIERGEMKPQLLEKVAKLEDWRKELKLMEEKKADWSAP